MQTNDNDELLKLLAGTSVCNFCSRSEPLVRYVVQDVLTEEQDTHHVGQWLACGPCASMITQKNNAGLLALAKAHLHEVLSGKVDRDVIDAHIGEMHKRFWQSWHYSEDEAA
jgi:hypothetical protein